MATAASATLPTTATIYLDVAYQNLPNGDLLTWFNKGTTAAGVPVNATFVARGTAPVVSTFNGRRAVTFTGVNGYRAIDPASATGEYFKMPGQYTGNAEYTVSMVVFNPGPQGTERIFGWTRLATADRGACIFGYGTNASYGVSNHWGSENDMGFDRGVPKLGQWHNITVTYAGSSGWEKVYVDGIINAIERKPDDQQNNCENNGPVWIGCTDDPSGDQNFSGSLASLRVYDVAATFDEVLAISGQTYPALRSHPIQTNADFEAGIDWAPVLPSGTFINMGDNRIIPGWSDANNWVSDGNPATVGIGVCGKNIGLAGGGGYWDNGKGLGNRVLAIAATDTAPRAVSQWLTLRGGQAYRVYIKANAKTGGSAIMKIYFNGVQEGSDRNVFPVDNAGVFDADFYTFGETINPTVDGHYELKIEQANIGSQNVLLLDSVEVFHQDPQVPIVVTPNPLDFGQVARSATVNRQYVVRNLSNRTLDLWGFSRVGANSTMIDITDSIKPGTSTDGNNIANIRIDPYDRYTINVRFINNTTTATKNGQLRLRWRNGPYREDANIPWTAETPSRPYVRNASFEMPITSRTPSNPFCYYNQMGDNVEIPFWTAPVDGIGVGARSNHPYVNNGSNPVDGPQKLWIHNNTGHFPVEYGVSQMIAGWDKATTYTISLWANSRNTSGWNPAQLIVKVNGVALQPRNGANWSTAIASSNLKPTTCTIVTGGTDNNPQYTFIPPYVDNGMYLLEILGRDNGTNKVLNVDQVQIFSNKIGRSTSLPQLPVGLNSFTGTRGLNSNNVTLNVFNNGGTTLTISNMAIVGENAAHYVRRTTGSTFTVHPFGFRTQINLALNAKDVGYFGNTSFQFQTNDGTTGTINGGPVSVPLYGSAVAFPQFANGSFELPVAFWANDGTWRNHLHTIQGQIPLWTRSGDGVENYGIAIPIDTNWQNLYWNNGAPTRGNQALWIETSTTNASGNLDLVHAQRQTVYGFYTGQTYKVTMWVNARRYNDAMVSWTLRYGRDTSNYAELIAMNELSAVAALNDFTVPFKKFEAQFLTTSGGNMNANGSVAFEIQVPNQPDQSSLLIDEIMVEGPPTNAVKSWASFE